jgi:hypothetical protein
MILILWLFLHRSLGCLEGCTTNLLNIPLSFTLEERKTEAPGVIRVMYRCTQLASAETDASGVDIIGFRILVSPFMFPYTWHT